MRTIRFIIRKEFQQLRRDRRLLPMILLSPHPPDRPPGVRGEHGREGHPPGGLRPGPHAWKAGSWSPASWSPEATWQARTCPDAAGAERSIEEGKSSLALVIPPGFGRSLRDGTKRAAAASCRRLGDPVRRHRADLCHPHRLPGPDRARGGAASRAGPARAAPGRIRAG